MVSVHLKLFSNQTLYKHGPTLQPGRLEIKTKNTMNARFV